MTHAPSPHVATVEAALRALSAGEQTPSFTKPQARELLAAIGAVNLSPQDLQRVGLVTLQVLLQASRADAITERAMRLAANKRQG